MAVNTLLLDFSVDPKDIHNENQLSVVSTNIENVLRDYLTNLKLLNNIPLDGGCLKLYTSDLGAITTVRIFNNGVITINIEYFKGEKQEPLLDNECTKEIEQKTYIALNCFRSKLFPVIKRASSIDVYLTSSDDRLLEYDVDEVLFDERSPYQRVQVVHCKSIGNMLVLDDLQNIAEADLIYTETLMCRGKESYKDKEIVILGGGDGALLYELLKESPKNVIMLEIDDVVIKACAKHMRSICGDVLDRKSAPNYQIILGDCMKSLNEFIKEGRKFDYIFGDLTDIPIREANSGELWAFISKILDISFKVLKPDGRFMTHGNGASCEEALKTYDALLAKLQPPVVATKSKAFIPSFLEEWRRTLASCTATSLVLASTLLPVMRYAGSDLLMSSILQMYFMMVGSKS